MTYPHNPCPDHDRDPCPECERYGRSWCAAPGDPCWHADIAPLLAELATLREQHNELREAHNRAMTVMSTLTTEVLGLRERTRRRDAATEPPPVGVPVLALDRGGMYRWRTATYDIDATGGVYRDERTGFDARVVSWWPLPEVGDV